MQGTDLLPIVLDRFAREVVQAAATAERLQATLRLGTAGMEDMQALDLLTQSLADLGRFLGQLAPFSPLVAVPLHGPAAQIGLHSLALRLQGLAVQEEGGSGDMELFA